MRFRAASVIPVITVALSACAGSSAIPTAPDVPAAFVSGESDNPRVPGDRWHLTTIQTAVIGPGPKVCWRNPNGTRFDWVLAVQRSVESVNFLYVLNNWPYNHMEHKGRVSGNHFIGNTESQPGYFPCDGTQVQFAFEAEVSGQFSTDGRALTATEVWNYRLTSGEAVSISFDWVANRR